MLAKKGQYLFVGLLAILRRGAWGLQEVTNKHQYSWTCSVKYIPTYSYKTWISTLLLMNRSSTKAPNQLTLIYGSFILHESSCKIFRKK